MGFKSHILKKKHRISHRSRVDSSGRCTDRSFDKPRLVQPRFDLPSQSGFNNYACTYIESFFFFGLYIYIYRCLS